MTKVKNTEEDIITPQQQVAALFKTNKNDHVNTEKSNYSKTKSSSLIANSIMSGGLPSGATRMIGNSSGGKSSCSLDFMYNFLLESNKRKGAYYDAEGKLNENIQKRSGIKFVKDPEQWEDGTCLLVQTNVFEFVFKMMGDLMRNNPTNTNYFFIVDSVDMLSRRDDLLKEMEDSAKVAGGAVLSSVFLKQTSYAMAKRGHYCIFISQVRDAVKIDPRQKTDTNKQGKASGGHALEHAPEWVLDFGPRFQDDIIREDPNDKNSKPIGHYCTIRIIKSNNETYGQEIRYPIKYGRTGGKSVWIEKELADYALMWNFVKRDKNSYYFSDELKQELKDNNIEIPEKFVGINKYMSFFEEREDICNYLYDKFVNLLN
jgi:RecA/RadA recombinase